jgi:hypothetical protein
MNISQMYTLISIAVLSIIAVLLFFVKKNKKEKRFTPLAGIAFSFVLAGIIFSDDRLIGYSLMVIGIIIAVVDIIIIKKGKKKHK